MAGGGGGHGGHGGHGGGDAGIGGGSGRESPPAAKLIQCDERSIVSVRRFNFVHVVGCFFLVIGLYVIVAGLIASIPLGMYLGVIFSVLLGGAFAAIGYLAVCPLTLRIDVATVAYEERFGWRPFYKVTRGDREDFNRLSMRKNDINGKSATLLLYWNDSMRQPFALHTADETEVKRYGKAVAALLGLRFLDASYPIDYPIG